MSIKVIKPGFLSSIQDYGRITHASYGMSVSGVMDEQAYMWGNYLLENHFNAAALEIVFGSVTLEVLNDSVICITGADLDFKINNKRALTWHSVQVYQGDVLSWGVLKSGVRGYLCVKDGFETDVMFDSRSVNLRENIGEKIQANEVLKCSKSNDEINHFMAAKFIPNYEQALTLRILPSYQFNEFSLEQRELFFAQTYQISSANDRTGARLSGVPIAKTKSKMISEGISYGSVEIATDGLPIILLKDAPTIGGYPKIGTVFSLDLAKLAQKQMGDNIKFELMDIEQAQKQRAEFNKFFAIEY